MHKIPRNFKIQIDPLISAKKIEVELIDKKMKNYHRVDLAVKVNHGGKIKDSETISKYLDLARKLKNESGCGFSSLSHQDGP